MAASRPPSTTLNLLVQTTTHKYSYPQYFQPSPPLGLPGVQQLLKRNHNVDFERGQQQLKRQSKLPGQHGLITSSTSLHSLG